MTPNELLILQALTQTWDGDPLGESVADEVANNLSSIGIPRRAQGVATQLRGLERRGLVTSHRRFQTWKHYRLTDWGLKILRA